MIAKKVPRAPTKSKAASIRDLVDYIRAPHNLNPAEKVLYAAGRNFVCGGHAAQREEMVALATDAINSTTPVEHYILSWHEDEQPTPQQIEEAVDIFLGELGVSKHQTIYALHRNTDNLHLHIALNRVNPQTARVHKINRGFDVFAIHKAAARIEHAQGWRPERNARYHVLEDGSLSDAHVDPDQPRTPKSKQMDKEIQTGIKSAQRIAIEIAAPIIKQAQSWEQLHRELREQGMRYESKGSGAIVFVGDVAIKAGRVDRNATLHKIQQRLGAYEPSPDRQPLPAREPEPLRPDVPGWSEYSTERKAHLQAKAAARAAIDQRYAVAYDELLQRQRAYRTDVLGGSWRRKGAALNALRSALADEQTAEKAALREQHRLELAQWRQQYGPYPNMETWLYNRDPELAEQWRHQTTMAMPRDLGGQEDTGMDATITLAGPIPTTANDPDVGVDDHQDVSLGNTRDRGYKRERRRPQRSQAPLR